MPLVHFTVFGMNVGGVPWTGQKDPGLEDGFSNVMILCGLIVFLILIIVSFPLLYARISSWRRQHAMRRSWSMNRKSFLSRTFTRGGLHGGGYIRIWKSIYLIIDITICILSRFELLQNLDVMVKVVGMELVSVRSSEVLSKVVSRRKKVTSPQHSSFRIWSMSIALTFPASPLNLCNEFLCASFTAIEQQYLHKTIGSEHSTSTTFPNNFQFYFCTLTHYWYSHKRHVLELIILFHHLLLKLLVSLAFFLLTIGSIRSDSWNVLCLIHWNYL